MDTLSGYVESILFSDENQGFTVAKLKQPNQKDLICIVGKMPALQPGETVSCQGTWRHHAQHGRQFEVKSFESRIPSDLVGIQKYLESGMIKGIGPAYAKRIIKKFGLETLNVIDANPRQLLDVEGIGAKRVDTIEKHWQQQKSVRDVMVFLRKYNVPPSFAQKIYKTYGDQSIEKVQADPYSLARDIHGIGFLSADRLAQSIGIGPDAPVRIRAGVEHLLWELSNEGHVCFPENELIEKASTTLDIQSTLIQEELSELENAQRIVRKTNKVWIKPLFLTEVGIARELARLTQVPCNLRNIHTQKALDWVEEKLHIKLAKEQKKAIAQATSDKVHLITGGPGTGKSTITKAILRITEKLTNRIVLAAPTGRAAKRMSQITHKKAFTIHALLEMDFKHGGFKRNRNNPLSCDLIIIDEASMIDTQLMYHLLKAVPDNARLLLIGDIDQLPSVGPGNVLKDFIASQCIAVTRLKQIFRQAAGSRIIVNAHLINKGFFPDLKEHKRNDFLFIDKETPEEVLTEIVDLVSQKIPSQRRFHKFDDIQVLAPMRKGIIGTENLNIVLQQKLNPHPTPLMRQGRCFHPGDKVMQIRNNYQKHVYNGDVGKITTINTIDQQLEVNFDGKLVIYEFLEIDELVLAYAVSVHKYQGSECPCIVMPIHTTHFKLLYRNLLYTGITRGKKLVVLIGSKKALAIAVKNDEIQARHTDLISAIQDALPSLQAEPSLTT